MLVVLSPLWIASRAGWAPTDFSQTALACFRGELVPSVWAHLKKVAGSFVLIRSKVFGTGAVAK